MIEVNNAVYDAATGKLCCRNCGRELAILHNPKMSLVMEIVCRCETLCEVKVEKIKRQESFTALNIDGSIICRKCGKTLFETEKSAMINFAFRARCDCGAVFEKAEKYRKQSRRLGEFAGISESDI